MVVWVAVLDTFSIAAWAPDRWACDRSLRSTPALRVTLKVGRSAEAPSLTGTPTTIIPSSAAVLTLTKTSKAVFASIRARPGREEGQDSSYDIEASGLNSSRVTWVSSMLSVTSMPAAVIYCRMLAEQMLRGMANKVGWRMKASVLSGISFMKGVFRFLVTFYHKRREIR